MIARWPPKNIGSCVHDGGGASEAWTHGHGAMTPPITVLAQTPSVPPIPATGDQGAWPWVAAFLASLLVAVLWRYLSSLEKQIADWKDAAREGTTVTKENTVTMGRQTEAFNSLGARIEKLENRLEQAINAEWMKRRP